MLRTRHINLKMCCHQNTNTNLSFPKPSLSICMLWHLLFPHVCCPSILSCALLLPPSVVFDESTFILCLTQSSIWLSTLCSNNPHACACTHKWVLLSGHPHAHQAAVHTHSFWTCTNHLYGTQTISRFQGFLLDPHINISGLKAAIYSGFKLFTQLKCVRDHPLVWALSYLTAITYMT